MLQNATYYDHISQSNIAYNWKIKLVTHIGSKQNSQSEYVNECFVKISAAQHHFT